MEGQNLPSDAGLSSCCQKSKLDGRYAIIMTIPNRYWLSNPEVPGKYIVLKVI